MGQRHSATEYGNVYVRQSVLKRCVARTLQGRISTIITQYYDTLTCRVIIFASVGPGGILKKVLYREAPPRGPTP